MTESERIITQALALSPGDRLDVIEQLWDSLTVNPDALEITDAQRQELDRRIAEMDSHPDRSIPWPVVQSRLHERK